jgi:hypothetical protein
LKHFLFAAWQLLALYGRNKVARTAVDEKKIKDKIGTPLQPYQNVVNKSRKNPPYISQHATKSACAAIVHD